MPRRPALLTVAVATLGAALAACGGSRPSPTFEARFGGADRLLTNEYAFHHPTEPGVALSPQWIVTSGSLFVRGGTATNGRLDRVSPDARSATGTNSAVFRAYTRRRFRPGYRVTLELLVRRQRERRKLDAVPWDGVHLMLDAASPRSAYYVSLYRRDGQVVIKKKTAPGPVDGGRYQSLSEYVQGPIVPGRWTPIRVDTRESRSGAVTIDLYEGGVLVATATDDRALSATPPLVEGRLGIRADETTFSIRDLTLSQF